MIRFLGQFPVHPYFHTVHGSPDLATQIKRMIWQKMTDLALCLLDPCYKYKHETLNESFFNLKYVILAYFFGNGTFRS